MPVVVRMSKTFESITKASVTNSDAQMFYEVWGGPTGLSYFIPTDSPGSLCPMFYVPVTCILKRFRVTVFSGGISPCSVQMLIYHMPKDGGEYIGDIFLNGTYSFAQDRVNIIFNSIWGVAKDNLPLWKALWPTHQHPNECGVSHVQLTYKLTNNNNVGQGSVIAYPEYYV